MIQAKNWDQVAIHNIDDEDFVFQYDASQGSSPYVIPAGEVKRLPKFLAKHALKHLVDKILNKRNIRINHEPARRDLMEQIVVGEEKFDLPAPKTDTEKTNEVIDEMNRQSDLDRILERKRKAEEEAEDKLPKPEPDTPDEEEEFAGLKKKDSKPEKKESKKKEVPAVPTRKEIYKYAEDTLKMTITDKEKKKFDRMKIDELLKEIGDPRESLA